MCIYENFNLMLSLVLAKILSRIILPKKTVKCKKSMNFFEEYDYIGLLNVFFRDRGVEKFPDLCIIL